MQSLKNVITNADNIKMQLYNMIFNKVNIP
jgi:hypothetical protein